MYMYIYIVVPFSLPLLLSPLDPPSTVVSWQELTRTSGMRNHGRGSDPNPQDAPVDNVKVAWCWDSRLGNPKPQTLNPKPQTLLYKGGQHFGLFRVFGLQGGGPSYISLGFMA